MNLQFITVVYVVITYVSSYLYKAKHTMSELMKRESKEVYGKDIKGKTLFIGNIFLTKRDVSPHEVIKRVLFLFLRQSSIGVMYVPTSLKKNTTRMSKSWSVLEKMYSGDTSISAFNIIDKYENGWDNSHLMCLADFPSNYVSKKTDDLPIKSFKSKAIPFPVCNIDDVRLVQI